MSQSEFLIGEVAAQAGVSIDAVRYYERRRLLPHALRTRGGYRLFTRDAIERIRFIRQAQEIGLSLGEIAQLFSTRGTARECQNVHTLLLEKLADLETRMARMRAFKKVLKHHLATCEAELKARGEEAACPALSEIEESDGRRK